MNEESSERLVEVAGLTKAFGPIRAVDRISFDVRRGDVLGFLGPNGAGKTTAMKMITGFLEPDAGRARVAGHDVGVEALAARQRLGYLPENAPAYGEMTVDGFLDFVAHARALPNRRESVDRAVTRTGLSRVRGQTVETLSKGFKRRVGLAQALVHDPEVLLLDEPTDGLDPNQKLLVHDLIAELAPSRAIILSTHILEEVEKVCNRVIIISEGRILVDGTPAGLVGASPRHHRLHLEARDALDPELLARLEASDWCRQIERTAPSRAVLTPHDGANRLAEVAALVGPDAGIEIRLEKGRLEDIFRDVTGGVVA